MKVESRITITSTDGKQKIDIDLPQAHELLRKLKNQLEPNGVEAPTFSKPIIYMNGFGKPSFIREDIFEK